MNHTRIRIGQTIATLVGDERHFSAAEEAIRHHRGQLEAYLARHRAFATTLRPISPLPGAPDVVRLMAEAAEPFGVGPMAAVAGAIAQLTLEAMARDGATHAMVDNGGDIALLLNRPARVGLFAGSSPFRDLALAFPPRTGIFGVCTSSGTVGHSLSFGCADAATVVASSAIQADAAATALCNVVKEAGRKALHRTLERFPLRGLEGILVIAGEYLATRGKLPPLVRTPVDFTRVSFA